MTGTLHYHTSRLCTTISTTALLGILRFTFYLDANQRCHLMHSFGLRQSTAEYARNAIARADHAHQLDRKMLTASQQMQKHSYYECHCRERFPVGSIVLFWSPTQHVGLSEKLSRFTGPYHILR